MVVGLTPNHDSENANDPELSIADFVTCAGLCERSHLRSARSQLTSAVINGEALFDQVGCAVCHIPSLPGPTGPVNAYSNFLLHDVMPTDFRGMAEPGADVGMYRTPPLWGIRHTAPYMHDCRAEDLHGAILAHFSEGDSARVPT